MSNHPLGEVFGFPTANQSDTARRYREHRLCPFNNRVPNCTKDKANDPLGVCSVYDGDNVTITCPIRFRENWLIAEHAAAFFFGKDVKWTSLTEVRLNDKNGRSAGNIDVVLVAYDEQGRVMDFGSLEVQAVYISGNIRRPFQKFMSNTTISDFDWTKERNYPRPDYLSSSRKRLAPQMIFKGGSLKSWNKKQAVAVDSGFYSTLPSLKQVAPEKADIAWLIYDLKLNEQKQAYELSLHKTVYTEFGTALSQITTTEAGPIDNFVHHLQEKLDERLEGNAPEAPTLGDVILS
ncbi:MAG: NotI family restriction endonuclease [Acidobacteriota bacterium]|mgnify:CR=1 FL=1